MCLPLPITSTLVYYLEARLDHAGVEPHTGVCTNSRLLVLPTNIRPGWKWPEVTNTLAYYNTATITAVKSWIVLPITKSWKIETTLIQKGLQWEACDDSFFQACLIIFKKVWTWHKRKIIKRLHPNHCRKYGLGFVILTVCIPLCKLAEWMKIRHFF